MKHQPAYSFDDSTPVDEAMLLDVLACFAPPVRLSSAEWAETNIVLPSESNAEPGKLKLASYQRQMCDACDDPHTHTAVFKVASQVGKSLVADIVLLSSIAQNPGPSLLVHPTTAKATGYVRDRFEPIANATPAIKALIGLGRSQGSNTQSHKSYPGGSLNIASSHVAEDLAARSIKFLIMDEVDRFARSAGKEGDPITLAIKRQRTFRNRKTLILSTPTQTGASRIDDWYQKGTQEKFALPCPECGCMQIPVIEQLKWPKGNPKKATLECSECAHPITERERLKAIDLGVFIATNPKAEPGIRSFHASELISKFSSLASVAQQHDDAATPEQKKVFSNTVLAETYDINAETFSTPEGLQSRAETIISPYPAAISFFTAAADVQRDRIEVLFMGHGPANEKWVIDRIVIGGDTTGETPWQVLSQTIKQATFALADGRRVPLSATFVDAGYLTTRVYEFAKTHQRTWPIFGRAGWDKPTVRNSTRVQGPLRSLILGIDTIKMGIAKALAMETLGPGYIHLPMHLVD